MNYTSDCTEIISILFSGLVADIDIESEKFRWMGSARFDVYVRFCWIFLTIICIEGPKNKIKNLSF